MSDDTIEVRIYKKAFRFFQDCDKTDLWMKTDNANLGGVSPLLMIHLGRAEKLEKWIDQQLDN